MSHSLQRLHINMFIYLFAWLGSLPSVPLVQVLPADRCSASLQEALHSLQLRPQIMFCDSLLLGQLLNCNKQELSINRMFSYRTP